MSPGHVVECCASASESEGQTDGGMSMGKNDKSEPLKGSVVPLIFLPPCMIDVAILWCVSIAAAPCVKNKALACVGTEDWCA